MGQMDFLGCFHGSDRALVQFTPPLSASPGLINFQGLLTDSEGTAVNTTATLTVRIFSNEMGGTANWSETHSSVAVQDGVVDVADAMLAMRIATGQTPTTQADLLRADVAPLGNVDGVLDVADTLPIMRKASDLASF
jgi:hypothetical protein